MGLVLIGFEMVYLHFSRIICIYEFLHCRLQLIVYRMAGFNEFLLVMI